MELPRAPASPSRARWLSGTLVGLVVFGSLFWLVHPWYDATNDGSMYIATARAILAGEGYSYLGTPFLIRPPGFSYLIAPLLALFGTSFLALNLAVSLSGALGVLLFLGFLRERLGLLLASLVALAVWFNPGYQRFSNQVMSDVPGWTLLVLCFLLERRERGRGPWGAVRLGLAVGLSTYVRSGNLLFLPAVAAARLCAFSWKRRDAWRSWALESAALFLAGFLVLAPWSVRNRLVAPEPPADQTLLYDYSTGMFHEDMGDPRSP